MRGSSSAVAIDANAAAHQTQRSECPSLPLGHACYTIMTPRYARDAAAISLTVARTTAAKAWAAGDKG